MTYLRRTVSGLVAVLALAQMATALGVLEVGRVGDKRTLLRVERYTVHTTVTGLTALTIIDQVFKNETGDRKEGIYEFSLPPGAIVKSMALWINGEPVYAEVKRKEQARQEYDDIVMVRRDPALLEELGGNLFQLSIFPIEPYSSRRIELQYIERLVYRRGEATMVLDLSAEELDLPIDTLEATITVIPPPSMTLIPETDNPFFDLVWENPTGRTHRAHYAEMKVSPTSDLTITLKSDDTKALLDVISYMPLSTATSDLPGTGFIAMQMALPETTIATRPQSVVFVVDVSGSMADGTRMQDVRAAMMAAVDALSGEDLFTVVAFNSTAWTVSESLLSADGSAVTTGKAFIQSLIPGGGTRFDTALYLALSVDHPQTHSPLIIFITDGHHNTAYMPLDVLADSVLAWNPTGKPIVPIGVGSEVNTSFLSWLAENNRAIASVVNSEDALTLQLGDVIDAQRFPLWSDIALSVGGAVESIFQRFPVNIPPLFAGRSQTLVGRYIGGGAVHVDVDGIASDGQPSKFSRSANLAKNAGGGEPQAALLWAKAAIENIVREMALFGEIPELVESVIALSLEHQILSPYTAFLAIEPQDQNTTAISEASRTVQWYGVTFEVGGNNDNGGGLWIDTRYETGRSVTEVVEGSTKYWLLVAINPLLRDLFALEHELIVVEGDVAYHFTPDQKAAKAHLGHSYPNPATTIPYTLLRSEKVNLSVFSLTGQLVQNLVDGVKNSGTHRVVWDGRDFLGRSVGSGMYVFLLRTENYREARMLQLMR